jgi:hypothetical protein
MGMFWARVEIHKSGTPVPSSEYTDLHAAMQKIEFHRNFTIAGRTVSLPPAEYLANKPKVDLDAAFIQVKAAAKSVLKTGQSYMAVVGEITEFRST